MDHIIAISWTNLNYWTRTAFKKLPEAAGLFHSCQLVLQEQMHYLSQIQYYVTFEVLECGWHDFEVSLEKCKDLDELLKAHQRFLDKLMGSCLLNQSSQDIAGKIRGTFDSVGTFQDLLKDLFTICETELTRRQSEKLTTGYSHSTEETQKRNEFKKYIKSNLHPKVEVRKNAWRKLVTDMLSGLLSEEDEYLRSLAWRLDFSRHYYKA